MIHPKAKINAECIPGVKTTCYGKTAVNSITAEVSCNTNTHADSQIIGSFCPIFTDTYTFYPTGSITNSQYTHNLIIKGVTISFNEEKSFFMYSGQCYPYNMIIADMTSTSGKIQVKRKGYSFSVLNSSLSIACQYDGCINGGRAKRNCALPSCKTKAIGMNKFVLVFMLNVLSR